MLSYYSKRAKRHIIQSISIQFAAYGGMEYNGKLPVICYDTPNQGYLGYSLYGKEERQYISETRDREVFADSHYVELHTPSELENSVDINYDNYRNDFDFRFSAASNMVGGNTLVSSSGDINLGFTFGDAIQSMTSQIKGGKLVIKALETWFNTLEITISREGYVKKFASDLDFDGYTNTLTWEIPLDEIGKFSGKLSISAKWLSDGTIVANAIDTYYQYDERAVYDLTNHYVKSEEDYFLSLGMPFKVLGSQTKKYSNMIRVEGGVRYDENTRDRNPNIFKDQNQNSKLLYSLPVKKKTLTLSGLIYAGIPDFMCDKTIMIFSLDKVKVNGVEIDLLEDGIKEVNENLNHGMYVQKITYQDRQNMFIERSETINLLNENGIPLLDENQTNLIY